ISDAPVLTKIGGDGRTGGAGAGVAGMKTTTGATVTGTGGGVITTTASTDTGRIKSVKLAGSSLPNVRLPPPPLPPPPPVDSPLAVPVTHCSALSKCESPPAVKILVGK